MLYASKKDFELKDNFLAIYRIALTSDFDMYKITSDCVSQVTQRNYVAVWDSKFTLIRG